MPGIDDELARMHAQTLEILELLHDDDPGSRRRLAELRRSSDYEIAFTETDPLVSVLIPTYTRTDTLVERAIPSALGQTHHNLEVIVVGDASPPDVGQAVAALDDPRVRFHNLTIRGPYAEDRLTAWHSYGTPGFNAGLALARGRWIAPLGDDDAFEPDHVSRLLGVAQRERFEFVYGKLRSILPDGSQTIIGEFPPRLTQIGLQAALFHSGLGFVELELGHALFHKPNDWGFVHRLMRIGVRMGMVPEVTVSYWPSQLNHELARHTNDGSRATRGAHDAGAHGTRIAELEGKLVAEQVRAQELSLHAADLSHRLDEVRRSRSWRLTAPLRALRGRTTSSAPTADVTPNGGESSELPVPPDDLLIRVGVSPDAFPTRDARVESFLDIGERVYKCIRESVPYREGQAVLDFGCGSGRVLRWFAAEPGHSLLAGCDIHAPSIEWLKGHLSSDIHLFVNDPAPPLAAPSDTFDLVYCGSVFSHLTDWAPWLLEVRRILKPGGALVASLHGRGFWDLGFHGGRGVPWDEDNTGILVEHYGSSFERGWGPAVYVSEWWVREHWGRAFLIERFEPSGFGLPDASHGQAWIVARKPGDPHVVEAQDLERPSSDPRETSAALRGQQLAYEEVGHLIGYLDSGDHG